MDQLRTTLFTSNTPVSGAFPYAFVIARLPLG